MSAFVMERAGWALLLLLLFGMFHRWVRSYQRRRITPVSKSAEARLIVVVASGCAICPAQKEVVAQLRQHYPSLLVETIEAETQRERVRELSVMTVPTTLLLAAGGAVVHINNGFITLERLSRQVAGLMRP